jgi:hypothetical protein
MAQRTAGITARINSGKGARGRPFSVTVTCSERDEKMRKTWFAAGALALALSASASTAEAGCLKGALIGGLGGHLMGHGVAGAAAGCAVGHYRGRSRARAAYRDDYRGSSYTRGDYNRAGYSGVNRY